MSKHFLKRVIAAALGAAITGSAASNLNFHDIGFNNDLFLTAAAESSLDFSSFPAEYQYAADWIYQNRVQNEQSMTAWNTIYDQIVAGDGTLNYIIQWQSYKTITLDQRQKLEQVLEDAVNSWTDWLVGYDEWPYSHVEVNIVGWAVLDKSCLLDLQPNETVYSDTEYYDPSDIINSGMANSEVPDIIPSLPMDKYRYEHWNDPDYEYPSGYENRFDMHLTATQGMIDMGGYGYYWGQQLSDNAILGLIDGTTSLHILQHEIGHGFGLTDFYGAEGATNGTPPGGFPGGSGSIMESGTSSVITDFDGWFLRYAWSKIKQETGRFEFSAYSDTIAGDVNDDRVFNVSDVVIMQKWLLAVPDVTLANWKAGDLCEDDRIDVFDLCLMKRLLVSELNPDVPKDDFITAPVKDVKGFLPSQGDANLVIFYIDFPDCRYDYAPTEEEIYNIAFGEEDVNNPLYPFESMSAFYNRSSKGAMNLKGTVLRYTTKNNQEYYNENKFLITQECYEAFKDTVDFSQYDGDNDGYIDATLLTVPTKSGDEHWWPCAGPVDQDNYYVDGKRIGHIITGNHEINSLTDYSYFNSTALHEMGHCMGLPDYYLFTNPDDSEGMHGTGGCEMMDTDSSTDFGSVSKLQLGWYTDKQIQIYDGSQDTVTFTLNNAQGNDSNCVLIPYGDLNNYHSEYMILEYMTPTGNNSKPAWWVQAGEGVRVYHADTSIYDHGWWVGYKYGSGSEFTDSDKGRRYLRIIDDVDGDNLYHDGAVIDNSIVGFNWYDSAGQQTIDTGLFITVSESDGDSCKVTITKK